MKALVSAITMFAVLWAGLLMGMCYGETDAIQSEKKESPIEKYRSIGSSLFLLGNLPAKDKPYYFMLNYGYEVNSKSHVFAEAITWTYYEPLGEYGTSKQRYPGKVRAIGLGVGYQRFIWKKLYLTGQITPFCQFYYNSEDEKLATGFQLYLQSRIGYRFEFAGKRWFVEPSIAENYWPINTNLPRSFSSIEKGKPNYYLFEPGLNFGFRF